MKKLLIIYASYGSGHKSVANYLKEYFKEHSNNYEIKVLDVMDYGNFIAKTNQAIYNLNFKYKSSLPYTISYEITDNKIITAPYKEMVKLLFKSQLTDVILDYQPDILISTHFFGSILLGMINKKYQTKTKIISILTDYASHSIWLKNHKNEDAIIVSNEIVKQELINYGVDVKKIYPFGIPLSNKFKEFNQNITKIKENYHILNNKPIYLFFGGGSQGSSFSYHFFKELLKQELDINIIFVTGKNQKLKKKAITYLAKHSFNNVQVLGFTTDVSNLLNIATCVITKPGGLAVTEALEMKKPMILIPGNGGQENHNANFVVKSGFGIKANHPKELARKVKKLTKNPSLIAKMSLNLKTYQENQSIAKLFNLVEKMVKK